jgi:glycogen debranching enzyme
VQYDDGSNAAAPIALVEVQGYIYQAKVGMARLLRQHGETDQARALELQACELKERFNRDFWMEEEGYFALALDREKRQVQGVSSNAGHCLWSGVCDADKAQRVADRLLAPDMFTGWGIRTLSSRSPNYNPMSYHNGSVWPHDTALIALGLRHVGRPREASHLVGGLFEAGFRFGDSRLPELFCGFTRDRRFNSSPTAYLVSCSPQAWAAGCIFMLLHSSLDLRPDRQAECLAVDPYLPETIRRLHVRNLRFGSGRISLLVEGNGPETRFEASAEGNVRVERVRR